MSRDQDGIAAAEFRRLKQLLGEQGVREGRCSFADVWVAVSSWMHSAPTDLLGEGAMVGWECSRNPNNGSLEHPEPPEGVPAGPLFNLALFLSFGDGGEAGVEFWYQADDDWEALTFDPDWDPDHPINLHGWGYPGARAEQFTAYLEDLPHLAVATRKPAVLFRVFKTGEADIAWHCA